MSSFLQTMAKSSAARAAAIARRFSDDDLDRPACPLKLSGFDLVAEIKNRSPAEGELNQPDGDRVGRARSYVEGGAAAISVLTEPDQFNGTLSHLEEIVAAVSADNVPVMRKDFLVDTVQVMEAKAAGASGVLLIAAMLDDRKLSRLLDCAFEYDLFVLLESFDEDDLQRTIRLLRKARYEEQADRCKLLFGVNTRDLHTLQVDPGRLKAFAPRLPESVACVAESGQHTAEDAAVVAGMGYRLALVGTALMRAGDPAALIRDMLTAGRAA